MGSVQTVTIGTDTFSVYALTATPLADLRSYWNGQLGATAAVVAAATDDNCKRSMAMAAQWMDRAVSFSGTLTLSTQPRQFPRDNVLCNGANLGTGVTPDNVARAEFELAGQLLVNAALAASTGQGSNVKNVGAGPASVGFFAPTTNGPLDTRLPIQANDLLKCMFASATGTLINFANGTTDDDDSEFDEDGFELTRGFA